MRYKYGARVLLFYTLKLFFHSRAKEKHLGREDKEEIEKKLSTPPSRRMFAVKGKTRSIPNFPF